MVENIDRTKFCRLLYFSINTFLTSFISPITGRNPSNHIDTPTNYIQKCAIDSRVTDHFCRPSRNITWWSTFLCFLRSKTRCALEIWLDRNWVKSYSFSLVQIILKAWTLQSKVSGSHWSKSSRIGPIQIPVPSWPEKKPKTILVLRKARRETSTLTTWSSTFVSSWNLWGRD